MSTPPALGRFLQTDPTGFGGGDMNLFRYCGGDPVNGMDPSGLDVLMGGVTIGGGFSNILSRTVQVGVAYNGLNPFNWGIGVSYTSVNGLSATTYTGGWVGYTQTYSPSATKFSDLSRTSISIGGGIALEPTPLALSYDVGNLSAARGPLTFSGTTSLGLKGLAPIGINAGTVSTTTTLQISLGQVVEYLFSFVRSTLVDNGGNDFILYKPSFGPSYLPGGLIILGGPDGRSLATPPSLETAQNGNLYGGLFTNYNSYVAYVTGGGSTASRIPVKKH